MFPAVAVIEFISTKTRLEVVWIGAREEFEGLAARSIGAQFRRIKAGKLRRYVSLDTLVDTCRVPIGIVQAWRILKKFEPDVIVSTGGFVSVPTVVAGRSLGIRTITHEQTAHIGLATRINARFCDRIALSYERSRQSLGRMQHKAVVTGNPIRSVVRGGDAARARQRFDLSGDLPLIYVTGGAQGARSINAAVEEALPELLESAEVIHQCGPRSAHADVERLLAAADQLPSRLRERYRVSERIGSELGDIYAAASLVVGRAGAGTVAELAAVGLPSILIPLPGAEEQRQNALLLAEAGAAILIDQEGLSANVLVEHVESILRSPTKLESMKRAALASTSNSAAERLGYEVLALAGFEERGSGKCLCDSLIN